MALVSDVDHVALNGGEFTSVQGNLVNNHNVVYNTFNYGTKRFCELESGDSDVPHHRPRKRQRQENFGIQAIGLDDLKLTREIGSGAGYFLHDGQAKGRAVIIKVFNSGPTARQLLDSTVALSQGLLHSNVLRIEGVSPPDSLTHLMVYESAWKTAEGPLAAALQDDHTRSITLGFKLVAGLSSGINHLCVQGIPMRLLGDENFDVFLAAEDRFLISINPSLSTGSDVTTGEQSLEDNTSRSWDLLNSLCQKVLRSANRLLHDENIERTAVIPLLTRRPQASPPSNLPAPSDPDDASPSQHDPVNEAHIPPRREYVWRTTERGHQSLASIASRIIRDLEIKGLSSINTWKQRFHGLSAHRCAGYVREEITLAATTNDSVVVFHDTPSPLEICSVCHEVVAVKEVLRCICRDPSTCSS
ncbi:hypothetical protein C8R47DRAFT_632283 [Mycena vitilis]|nr:hypothetical protein C8R47DRAFT_632283 [Mycena vitilis]